MDKGFLISLEGISGTGKTYFSTAIHNSMANHDPVFVREVSDRNGQGVDRKIIDVLHSKGDRFCRLGAPLTETFLLLALKLADYESYIVDALAAGQTVVEDRSIDTIAVYQAVILSPGDPGKQLELSAEIYDLAARWRRPPDLTFLIEDDFDRCIQRAEQRECQQFTSDELDLLRGAAELYARYAPGSGGRIIRLDRRTMDEYQIADTILAHINIKKREVQ